MKQIKPAYRYPIKRQVLPVIGLSLLMLLRVTPVAAGDQDDDRFSWRSNVWVEPSWSSSWGHRWGHDYRAPWRWGIGFSTGSAYWRPYSYRPYYRPYWQQAWRYPYRYERRDVVKPATQSTPVRPPLQITTGVQTSAAIKTLPANARVRQHNGATVYEWQGVLYRYDWASDSYQVVK